MHANYLPLTLTLMKGKVAKELAVSTKSINSSIINNPYALQM